MADTVNIRNTDTGQERTVAKGSLPFFVNQGYVVLTSDGRANTQATKAAQTATEKEN